MVRRVLIMAGLGAVAGAMLVAMAVPPASAQATPVQAASRDTNYSRFSANLGNVLMSQLSFGGNTLVAAFESALQRSRDTARADSKPIPKDIREALEPFYPDELLAKVRYSIGDTTPSGLAGLAIRNGNAAAVTLIDTIVFKDEGYTKDLALWAHEMHHVEQYRDWGLAGFASRYMFGWQAVEDEAEQKAHDYVAWYKKRTGQG